MISGWTTDFRRVGQETYIVLYLTATSLDQHSARLVEQGLAHLQTAFLHHTRISGLIIELVDIVNFDARGFAAIATIRKTFIDTWATDPETPIHIRVPSKAQQVWRLLALMGGAHYITNVPKWAKST